jgi:hypothetical protein
MLLWLSQPLDFYFLGHGTYNIDTASYVKATYHTGQRLAGSRGAVALAEFRAGVRCP